jgi:hypothetical protein
VVAWGDDSLHETEVPAAAQSGVVAIAAGNSHALALKSDGTVVAWGSNDYGQATVPPNLKSVVAISAGAYFSLALESNGTVVAWGNNGSGQLGVPAVPAGDRITAISAGCSHSLATWSNATTSNQPVAWGDDAYHETEIPLVALDSQGKKFNFTSASVVSAGCGFSLAIASNGAIVAWGDNTYGELNTPASLTNVHSVSAGYFHSVALRSDGTVVAWGSNDRGQLNVPAGLSNVLQISAGAENTLALRSDGTVVAWGSSLYGQTNVPASAAGATAVSAGGIFSLALVPQTVPGAPTGVVASPANGAASVSWNAPSSSGSGPITGYTATSSPDGKICATTGALSCNITGLTNGTAYTFTVAARNAVGFGPASAPSAPVSPFVLAPPLGAPTPTPAPTPTTPAPTPAPTPTTPAPTAAPSSAAKSGVPGAPTGVSGNALHRSARVSWTAPASDGGSSITGYTVTASPGGATCSTKGALWCTVTGLTNGTAYTFTVTATNATGTGAASKPSRPATPDARATLPPGLPEASPSAQPAAASSTSGSGGDDTPLLIVLVLVVGIAIVLAAAMTWMFWRRRRAIAPAAGPSGGPSSGGTAAVVTAGGAAAPGVAPDAGLTTDAPETTELPDAT